MPRLDTALCRRSGHPEEFLPDEQQHQNESEPHSVLALIAAVALEEVEQRLVIDKSAALLVGRRDDRPPEGDHARGAIGRLPSVLAEVKPSEGRRWVILALDKRRQELYVGVRNACYRIGRILVTGGVVVLAGALQKAPGADFVARGLPRPEAWSWAILAGALAYGVLLALVALLAPRPSADQPQRDSANGSRAPIARILAEYFGRPGFALVLFFILFYRLAESMLVPMISPFLMRAAEQGGLGLDEVQVGWIYGTFGVAALLVGGVLGGWLVSKVGLWRVLWPMALAMHLPNLLYAWAAHARPDAFGAALVVFVEQLGYGFGFSAYMVYLLQFARGSRWATTHYALSTGLMGLSAWLGGRWSGDLVEAIGFEHFFWLVNVLGLLGLATLVRLPRPEADPARRGSG